MLALGAELRRLDRGDRAAATAKIGADLVNVNPKLSAHEVEYALNQSGLRLPDHTRRNLRARTTRQRVHDLEPELGKRRGRRAARGQANQPAAVCGGHSGVAVG